MYDFYGNPPKTRTDLREWLTTWLVKKPDQSIFQVNNEKFIEELGFVRAFYIHSLLRNINTNEYVWWVYDKDLDKNNQLKTFPKTRYSNYEELLNEVIEAYYTQWRLTE